MTAKAELVYIHVLKGPASDLRPFSPLICQLLTPHSHQAPRGIHFRCFFFVSFSVAPSRSLVISLSQSKQHLIFSSSPIVHPLLFVIYQPFFQSFPLQFSVTVAPCPSSVTPSLSLSRPRAVSLSRARHCVQTLPVSEEWSWLMHSKH